MSDFGQRFNSAIAAELRAQRARINMPVNELTERTGLAKSTVVNYLNDKRDIPMSAFASLCLAMGVNQLDLFAAAQKALDQ